MPHDGKGDKTKKWAYNLRIRVPGKRSAVTFLRLPASKPMGKNDSDFKLLERIRAGEKNACAECIELHSPGIYRLALRLMKNEADAEEVVQETFLSAFRGIDRFDGRSGLRTWLYRIAYNAAMMRLRRPGPEMVSVEDHLYTVQQDNLQPRAP